jgi:hypothetical protein
VDIVRFMGEDGHRPRQAVERDAFEELANALETKRASLVGELQRMRYGEDLTLELHGGNLVRGLLHGCDGISVRLTGGQVYPLALVRGVVRHSHTDADG